MEFLHLIMLSVAYAGTKTPCQCWRIENYRFGMFSFLSDIKDPGLLLGVLTSLTKRQVASKNTKKQSRILDIQQELKHPKAVFLAPPRNGGLTIIMQV